MSEKIGQVYFARQKRSKFLDIMPEGAGEYSQATAELIDSEVRQIISGQYEKTLEILKEKRDVLEKATRLVMDKETITGEELRAML